MWRGGNDGKPCKGWKRELYGGFPNGKGGNWKSNGNNKMENVRKENVRKEMNVY